MSSLRELKRVFPNHKALHERITRALANSSTVKIGIIPHASSRKDISSVLNCLVADPIDDKAWYSAVRDRPLAKNTIVEQSAGFEYIETRNASVVFPVPFGGPPRSYLEVSEYKDNEEVLADCDVHLFCSTKPAQAIKLETESEHPSVLVLDNDKLFDAGMVDGNDATAANTFEKTVCTARALAGDELLRQSPQNISQWLEKHRLSGIEELKSMLTPEKCRLALVQSIFASCEAQLAQSADLEALNQQTETAKQLRTQWSQAAHTELQTKLMPSITHLLHKELFWPKLYARADDIESTSEQYVMHFMGGWRGIAAGAGANGGVAMASDALLNESSNRHRQPFAAARAVVANAGTVLANQGLNSVLIALGVQLPVGLCALGGYFLGYSALSMTGVGLMGLFIGLWRLQAQWYKAAEQYEKTVFEAARAAINDSETLLYELHEKDVAKQQALRGEQIRVLDQVKQNVQGLLTGKAAKIEN